MRVLLIGSGGREHALAWKLRQSADLSALFCAPGNAGMAEIATCTALDSADSGAVIAFCRDEAIDLVVVGPEAPLVAGLADRLMEAGIRVFGPGAYAAQLEGSKQFTKEICREAGVPTAAHAHFTDAAAAKSHAADHGLPVVIKADGLAAGKGVIIAESRDAAMAAIDSLLPLSGSLVIEEFLDGEEASFFALVDGDHAVALAGAQDHKRVGDGDTGPNTGGMGAYSPAPVVTEAMAARIMAEIIEPTVQALKDRGHPYRGVLYAGLMITADGPKLIEYNCRFGDPECQVLMARLDSDLLALMLATAEGRLAGMAPRWSADTALTVVMATTGYPGAYAKGSVIGGMEDAGAVEGVTVFHAGTARDNGALTAAGGRVLNVTARGDSVEQARERAYAAVDRIDWPEGFCRRDIAWRALKRPETT